MEHINKVSKVSGGIVGITRRDVARDKWCLTYNEKARLAEDTFKMFKLHVYDEVHAEWCNFETGPSRLKRDKIYVQKLMEEFKQFDIFGVQKQHRDSLICITTNDVVP